MPDWMEELGLHHFGFTDDEIAKIDAAKDDALHVVATLNAIWPRLTRLVPVANLIAARIAAQQQKVQQ